MFITVHRGFSSSNTLYLSHCNQHFFYTILSYFMVHPLVERILLYEPISLLTFVTTVQCGFETIPSFVTMPSITISLSGDFTYLWNFESSIEAYSYILCISRGLIGIIDLSNFLFGDFSMTQVKTSRSTYIMQLHCITVNCRSTAALSPIPL